LKLAQTNLSTAQSVIETLEKHNEVDGDQTTARKQLPRLIEALQRNKMLPAIFFHMSQSGCKKLLERMDRYLRMEQSRINKSEKGLRDYREFAELKDKLTQRRSEIENFKAKLKKTGRRKEEIENIEKEIQEKKEEVGVCEAKIKEIELNLLFHQDATLFKGENKFKRLTWEEINEALGGDARRPAITPRQLVSDPQYSALVSKLLKSQHTIKV